MSRSPETGPTTTDLGNGDRSPEASAGEGRRLNITVTQIGASAGAAATSALGASFFGAGGTITGAALGAVISTVAGSVYNHSLESAGERLKDTKVLVRKVPVGLRSRDPGSVPTHLGREVDAAAARQGAADGEPGPREPGGGSQVPTDPTGELPLVTGEPRSRPRRRQLAALGAVAVTGFGLAIGGITVAESLLGHPVSGGDGGTTVSEVVNSTSSGTTERQTEPGPAPTTSEPEEEPSPGTPSAGTPSPGTPSPGATTEGEVTSTPEPTESPAGTPTGEPPPTEAPAQTGGAESGAAGGRGGGLGASGGLAPAPGATN